MKSPQRTTVVVVLVATLIALPFLFLYHQPSVSQVLCDISTRIAFNISDTEQTTRSVPVPEQEISPHEANLNISEANSSDIEGLEPMLAGAATADKTVIITTLNQAWAAKGAMIDVFLESFHKGENTEFLLNHLVIVALDQKSFERCQELHRHCFMLKTEGVDFSGRKGYMTEDFLKMMWRRMVLLRTILEMGYNFVFTDADILWFRNPFDHFANNTDFQISSDKYRGNPGSFNNLPNCGYQYVQSNNRTIAMYRHWCKGGEDNPTVDEQTLFKRMLRHKEFSTYKVRIQFLETDKFSGFCQRSRNMTKVVTMHANCCTGMDNKVKDLRWAWKDWDFSRSHASVNSSRDKLWHVPAACRHSIWPSPPPRQTKNKVEVP
ncbi:hypothetical protein KC19_2G119200 [Ceratodon purpureus]|uniref:Nucleotide-diphospho-sugar transferase domain-containing protein n=2 Tax=Ceratodon purpureus TaxID=3225 RepID=A0A8T0IV34_CERPU|nr:hypothetical protein KC19_2G119200 [Ceratodon purpureus]